MLEFIAAAGGSRTARRKRLLRGEPQAALDRRIRRGKPGRQFEALEGVGRACRRSGQGPVRRHGNPWRERAKLALAAQARGVGAGLDVEIGGATGDVSGGWRRSPARPCRLWRAACRAFRALWPAYRDLWAGRARLPSRPAGPRTCSHAQDRKQMRELSDAMAELLRDTRGALTSGHGLGLARSEALERVLGARRLQLFKDLKTQIDPGFLLNPGKILRAPRFDDAAFLRAPRESKPDSAAALSWGLGSSAACALEHVRRCSGLGHCRSAEHNFTCPSYAVTRDEHESPRGRANAMRLALSGQLGVDALGADAMLEAMRLCVSCKFCGVTCPHGVDIPKLKVEALAAARAMGGLPRAADMFARLPEFTDWARRRRLILALRDLLPGSAAHDRALDWHCGGPALAEMVRAAFQGAAGGAEPGAARDRRALRGHLQPLLRARKLARRDGRLERGRLRRRRLRGRRGRALLLRTHLLRCGLRRGSAPGSRNA